MKRRHDRRISLGFQWDASSWENVPLWCDSLFARLKDSKVHWNLPAFPPDTPARKKASIARALRSRLESSGDIVTAMGFAGACHPLLNVDELEKEISWGVKNPWGTGIADVFDVRPQILVPRVPDLVRPDARKAYWECGFRLIGVCGESLSQPTGDLAGCFLYSRFMVTSLQSGGKEVKRMRRLIASAGDIFLLLDLSGLSRLEQLGIAMKELSKPVLARGPVVMLLPGPAPANPSPPPSLLADWTPFTPPLLHAKLDAAAGIARKKRKKNEEYHELLSLLGPGESTASARGTGSDQSERSRLVAHMLGEVALAGRDFDVRLSGGRFCGATRQGRDLLPRRPARSYIRSGAGTTFFKTQSSFSFEGESGTGLREELRVDGQAGAGISVEYSFRDDSPFLSIGVEVRFPVLTADAYIEEYAPLAIALRDLRRGEGVTVEVSAPDESAASVDLNEDTGGIILPGATHRIRRADGGWIRLMYATPDSRRWGLPFFRVTRLRGARILEMNPFGSYMPMPGTALSGRRERFSLLLGLEDG